MKSSICLFNLRKICDGGLTSIVLVHLTWYDPNARRTNEKGPQICRYCQSANDSDEIHDITEDINKLQEKNPKAEELKQSAIISTLESKTENVIFQNITQDEIVSSEKSSSGLKDQHRLTWKLGEK